MIPGLALIRAKRSRQRAPERARARLKAPLRAPFASQMTSATTPTRISDVQTLPQLLAFRVGQTPQREAFRAYDTASQS